MTMEKEKIDIDLRGFKVSQSTVFTGRPQGEDVRKVIDLNKYDKEEDTEIHIHIPEGTTSFNPSFFLGLLYDSIKSLGLDNFNNRYKIIFDDTNEEIKKLLQRNISDGLKYAENALNQRTGISVFLKNLRA